MIIAPALGLEMMRRLFPTPRMPANEPRAVWFQPGADSDEIAAFVHERGLGAKVVMGNHACVLVSGDTARAGQY
jgi:predicted CoA-binding protein